MEDESSMEIIACDVDEYCSGHAIKCMQRGSRQKCKCLEGWGGKFCDESLASGDNLGAHSTSHSLLSEYKGEENDAVGDYNNNNNNNDDDDRGASSSSIVQVEVDETQLSPSETIGFNSDQVVLIGGALSLGFLLIVIVFCFKRRSSKISRSLRFPFLSF
jgi:hypothetical protein